MVWKTIEEIFRGAANVAASAVTNTGVTIADTIKSGAEKLTHTASDALTQAGNFAVSQIDGSYSIIKTQIGKAIEVADDAQINLRDHIAQNLRAGGQAAATGAGVAAEFSLMDATGVLFYPIVAGAGMELSQSLIGSSADKLSKIVRGSRIRFCEVFVQEAGIVESVFGQQPDVLAIMYMPKNPSADHAGFALMSEEAIFYLERAYPVGSPEEVEFAKARMAVINQKRDMGIEPQSSDLRRNHIAMREL
jgi:hypothetical protein